MCLLYLYANPINEIHICSNKHETGLLFQTCMILSFKYVCSYYLISSLKKITIFCFKDLILRFWIQCRLRKDPRFTIPSASHSLVEPLNSSFLMFTAKLWGVKILMSFIVIFFVIPTDIPGHNCQ